MPFNIQNAVRAALQQPGPMPARAPAPTAPTGSDPWGTFGAPGTLQFRSKADNGEDASYWTPEDLEYFRSLGFDVNPRGISMGSNLSEEQRNRALAVGLIEGYPGASAPISIGGQNYQRIGEDPSVGGYLGYGPEKAAPGQALYQKAADQLRATGQIMYDPTYGWVAPYDLYQNIAKSNFQSSSGLDYMPQVFAALLGGAAGAGAGLGEGAVTLSAADTAGLAQMAADAGLTGPAAEAFVQSGGTLGSTAAGGGGVGATPRPETLPVPNAPATTPPAAAEPLSLPTAPAGEFSLTGGGPGIGGQASGLGLNPGAAGEGLQIPAGAASQIAPALSSPLTLPLGPAAGVAAAETAGTAAGTTPAAGGTSTAAADATGLAQMGAEAGLSGADLDAFVESGGTLGSTATSPGGVGTGAVNPFEKLLSSKAGNAALTTGVSAAGKALVGSGGEDEADAAIQSQQAEEARKKALLDRIRSLFGDEAADRFMHEEGLLESVLRGEYGAQLGKRYGEAEKQLRFGAARTGNLGGSQYAYEQGNLSEENRMGGARIEDAVQRAVEGLKGQREQAKLSAIDLVNAGAGEEAVNAASQGLKGALDTAKAGQRENLFTDLLGDVAFAKGAGDAESRNAALMAYLTSLKGKGGTGAASGSQPKIISTLPT